MPPGPALQSLRIDLIKEREMADELSALIKGLKREAGGLQREMSGVSRRSASRPADNYDTLSLSNTSHTHTAGTRSVLKGGGPAPSPAPSPLTPPLPHKGKHRDVLLMPHQTARSPKAVSPVRTARTKRSASPPSPLLSGGSGRWKTQGFEVQRIPHVPSPSPSPVRQNRKDVGSPLRSMSAGRMENGVQLDYGYAGSPLDASRGMSFSQKSFSPEESNLIAQETFRRQQSNDNSQLRGGGGGESAAERQQATQAQIQDLFDPLRTLGPFGASVFNELVKVSKQSSHRNNPSLEKYTAICADQRRFFQEAICGLLDGVGLGKARFLPHCYAKQAAVPLYGSGQPFRIACVGASDAEPQYLMRAVVEQIIESVVLQHYPSVTTFVFPVDWALILPPFVDAVDLGDFYARFIQHITNCLLVFRKDLEPQLHQISVFWKKLVTQHHLPHIPAVLQNVEEHQGIKVLAERMQSAYHERRLKEFVKGMFLLPHVLSDCLNLTKIVLVYRRTEMLGSAGFFHLGESLSEARQGDLVLATLLHTMSVCDCSVVLELTHRSEVELNTKWVMLGLEYLVVAQDLCSMFPEHEIGDVIKATRGCPEYIRVLLDSRRRLDMIESGGGGTVGLSSVGNNPVLIQKRQQMMFLQDAASAVMEKIDNLTYEVKTLEQEERMQLARPAPIELPSSAV